MAHRGEILIKTKYKTYGECIENCRDIKKRSYFTSDFSSKIHGEVFDDGSFELSSKRKVGNLFVFKGNIVERASGIYMEGELVPRNSTKYLVMIMLIFFISTASFLAYIEARDAMISILVFALVPWVYVYIYFRSDALYKDLMKKLT